MAYAPMGSLTLNRDTSKDTTLYTAPPTVYTDSTTLTAGMTLYDNTGTDTGKVVGTINGNSFDILTTPQMFYGYACGNNFIFADSTTPQENDKVYDENGDEISGAYFISGSYVSMGDLTYSITNVSNYIYFNPNTDSDWTLIGTAQPYSYQSSISLYTENVSQPLAEFGFAYGCNLILEHTGALGCDSDFTCVISKAVKNIILECEDWFTSTPITSYSNCTVQQNSKTPKVTPIDYTQPVYITYFNNC